MSAVDDKSRKGSTKSGKRIPHDRIFKTAFSHFLQDLVELVDPELAATLDLSSPRFPDKELFADFPGGKLAVPDLVAEAMTRDGDPRLILVHAEIEGEFRKTIDRRTWRYFMHLELKFDVPVISIVVFLTGGEAGVERRVVVEKVGSVEVNRFTYYAFGLSQSLAEAYVDRPQPLAAALAALMRSKVWDNVERKVRCLRAIRGAEVDDSRRFVLVRIVDTYAKLRPEEERRFEAELERARNKEVQDMVITWEDALADSEARGLKLGFQQGEAWLLKRQLKRRFGDLPEWVDKRLERASREELETWAERVLDAKRLEDVFDPE